ncbi:MAG: hypothetical protein JRN23_01030 [Nitrososphaerota archaeon]|nr:hypothetical protein [Nitrososphaerota archaeon]MDG6978198.1 hypothetical protein [Nitrososphaerota archaeon]MDG7020495.1 hypothetical protein [Nitrososphaerota archaeon]MDG7021936.1 hypothetical protein [Nitrososphaerota archaeon]
MGIKIMMPPEVVSNVAGALIARHALREIVKSAVNGPLDEHYFAVTLHKGVSDSLNHMSSADIAKILSCPTGTVHHFLADHMIYGSARGGCRVCNGASEELKQLIVEEKGKDRRSTDSLSLHVLLQASPKRRYGR